MRNKSPLSLPEPIVQLQHQLEEFRSSHPRRTKLPETFWQAAVELAHHHGLPVARWLRLDYTQLKKRLAGKAGIAKDASGSTHPPAPAFVELIASHPASMAEGVIEFESSVGSKMRIQWKGSPMPDWLSLFRAWRESER